MKRIIMVCVALAIFSIMGQQAAAEGNAARVRALEIELGAAMITPTDKIDFDKNKVGYNIDVELRYNLKSHPFDIGLRLDGNTFNRELKVNKDLFKFRSLNAMVVADWNINRKGIFSPFFGVGIGGGLTSNESMSIKDVTNQPLKQTVNSAAFCIMPRVGVELFHHYRLTFYYKYLESANSHFGLSVGFVIGGGRK